MRDLKEYTSDQLRVSYVERNEKYLIYILNLIKETSLNGERFLRLKLNELPKQIDTKMLEMFIWFMSYKLSIHTFIEEDELIINW